MQEGFIFLIHFLVPIQDIHLLKKQLFTARIEKKFKKAYAQSFVAFNQFQHLNFCRKVGGTTEKSPTAEPDPKEEHAETTKQIRQEESERGMVNIFHFIRE